MIKNIVIACGLGDFFTFLGRLDDFFDKNPEYTEVKFWTWLHHTDLAKEMAEIYSRTNRKVTVMSVKDMTDFLEEIIPEDHLDKAKEHFIRQEVDGKHVEKYFKFIRTFFPTLEEWIYLPVYKKYEAKYPFVLPVDPIKRDKPHIIVHPYSTVVKTEKPERHWQTRKWNWVINKMVKYYDTCDIILIGGKSDKIEEETCSFQRKAIDLRGKTSLEEALGLIYGSSGVIGTNSWPTLVSAWAKIPTYTQWFVQEQLIPTHYPVNPKNMPYLYLDKMIMKQGEKVHPLADDSWAEIREVLKDAANFVRYTK